tara:strand:+ start:928 stop:1185 length:258 start_codon:yes stop_codon:yes gene_type:complete
MKSLVVVLLIISIIFVAVGYIKSNQKCPPPIVQFRYIPKTFKEEQSTSIPILSQYGSMFKNRSPWQESVGYISNNKETTSLLNTS